MAGAGARTRKDGSASAKVGSIEVLRSRQIGPAVPMRRQVQAMATGAASAERAARTPAARAAAAELRAKAESAGQARAAFLAARKGSKAAGAAAAQEAGARAMRAGAAAQFAKAQPKAAEPVKVVVAKAPRKPVEPRNMYPIRERYQRLSEKHWFAQQRHITADPTHQALQEKYYKASARKGFNFKSREAEMKAREKSDEAAGKLSAHEGKLRAEWNAAHPREAAVMASANKRMGRASDLSRRQAHVVDARRARAREEAYKAEAPARAKAAAEAAVKAKAENEQTARDVAFLKARGAKHGVKFEHKDGYFHVEGKYGNMSHRKTSQEAKSAMRAAVLGKIGEVRKDRERAAYQAKAKQDYDTGVQKARVAVAAAPAAPKGHANIHAIHEHGAAPSVRPVKALAQAGDVVAHRPIGEHRKSGGEGYSITHGPTGLRIMHAGSAAEAKHIVAGLGTPHWSKMLEKTVAHDNEAARLTGEHVKRLAAEHASGGAKAAPTPKLAFGKMTSDNKFKAARAA